MKKNTPKHFSPVFVHFQSMVYPLSVFITGGCVLIIEVLATRMLSPFFGNTIFTVSSVISVILAALSIGYFWGGKIADRYSSASIFYRIINVSGILVLLFHILKIALIEQISTVFSLTYGPLISSLSFFFLPALFLGMLSPYAVKLQDASIQGSGVGTVAGTIFFWSTLGSIGGSLLAGFILIPLFGINQIILGVSVVLFGLGFLPLIFWRKKERNLLLFLFVSLLSFLTLTFVTNFFFSEVTDGLVYKKNGVYENITIVDSHFEGRPTRFLLQDRSFSGAMFLDSDDPTELVFDYTQYYSLYQLQPKTERVLVLGSGAYSIPKAFLAALPSSQVDVVDIEPVLEDLGKEYFNVPHSPRLHTYTEDGRRFLLDSDKGYDLIYSDVYSTLHSVPTHFTTQQFFEIAKESLNQDGMFTANIIGDLSRQQPSFILSEMKTFQSVFPNSYFFAVDDPGKTSVQNIMFLGIKNEEKLDFSNDKITSSSSEIVRTLSQKKIDVRRFNLDSDLVPILTDNYAPVDYFLSKSLQRFDTASGFPDGDEMMALISQQLKYGPRFISSPGHQGVRDFLIYESAAIADDVVTQEWQYQALDGSSHSLQNIIARINPDAERRIIVGTHYDSKKHADLDAANPENPVPGANDSASGVAVLIEVLRKLSFTESLEMGVDVVFFDGEEGDMSILSDYSQWKPLGSTYFSNTIDQLYTESNKPEIAVVIDMVCDQDFVLFKEQSSFDSVGNEVDRFWSIGNSVDETVFSNEVKRIIQDDHTPLQQAGIPSFLVIDYEYPYFHTTQDTVDKCSSRSLEIIAQTLFSYITSY